MIRVDPPAYIIGALLILTLPLDWILSALAAAIFHELCHVLVIYLLGGSIRGIRIGVSGAVIDAAIWGKGRELLCAIAGPSGSLLLASLCHIFPKAALCAFLQGLFNLLPIYPLDGGRILQCSLEMLCPSGANIIIQLVEKFTYLTLFVTALAASVKLSLGILPVFWAGILILKTSARKRPCKQGQIRVQ